MKYLVIQFFMLLWLTLAGNTYASTNTFSSNSYARITSNDYSPLQIEKNKYLILQFNKYDEYLLEKMISEFSSYENKIAEISFDVNTHHLMIYYTSLITLDEILQVVSHYFTDFEKIGGTEL